MINLANWFIYQDNHLLIVGAKDQPCIPTFKEAALLKNYFTRVIPLGLPNQQESFVAEIPKQVVLPDIFQVLPLRQALQIFNSMCYQALAKGIALINWDKNHQYCGQCAAATVTTQHPHEKACPNCHLLFYPRISPSIIVLIQRGDELLMARSPHFPTGVYGLIAGFIEAGESIETAVHREVMEEVNITITNLQYFGSQAWPFPDSLMIGFTADYLAGDIIIDQHEIEAANWYHFNNLPSLPKTKVSIANRLIEHFLQSKHQ